MNRIHEIECSLRNAWDTGGKVYIIASVEDGYNNVYPYGFDRTELGTSYATVTLSVGFRACKSFRLNLETGMFDYDICVGGKPFYGSLHPNSILVIFEPSTKVVYGNWDPILVGEHQEENEGDWAEPKLVAHNDHTTPKKSKAKLHLVH